MKATIDPADIDTVVLRHYLEQCTTGDEVYYRSTEYANLSGLWIEVRGTQLTCKCSVCKQWARKLDGRLDNWKPITWAMAARTLGDAMRGVFGRRVLGPNDPPVARVQNLFIKDILLKIEPGASLGEAKQRLRQLTARLLAEPAYRQLRLSFDVDPM